MVLLSGCSTPNDQTFLTSGHGYNLRVEFRASVTVGNESVSAEQVVYLGEMADGVLTSLMANPYVPTRTDFTVQEIKSLREEHAAATRNVRDIEGKLAGFGTFDS